MIETEPLSDKLVIVMATYNGASFLAEQLDSIRNQTFRDWTLIVRDDGSTDGTVGIINRYAALDDRIQLIRDNIGNLGTKNCFNHLFQFTLLSGATYVACSDQDDVWLPEKIEKAIAEMHRLESRNGKRAALLVHSDLIVVNEGLKVISPSYMNYEHISQPGNPPIGTLLVQNHVVGCTILCNRALLEVATPIPDEARMHDWWLAICAKRVGVLSYLPSTDIRYRQHHSNTLGATGFGVAFRIFSRNWCSKYSKWKRLYKIIIKQAIAAHEIFSKDTVADSKNDIASYKCLASRSRLRRTMCAWQLSMKGQNLIVTLIFYALLLLDR